MHVVWVYLWVLWRQWWSRTRRYQFKCFVNNLDFTVITFGHSCAAIELRILRSYSNCNGSCFMIFVSCYTPDCLRYTEVKRFWFFPTKIYEVSITVLLLVWRAFVTSISVLWMNITFRGGSRIAFSHLDNQCTFNNSGPNYINCLVA